MAVYLPNIPLPTDTLADSQQDIKDNFSLINTYIGVDHVAFNAASNQGKHSRCSFIGQLAGVVPTTVSGITLEAMSSFGGTRYNLFYREQNGFTTLGQTQLTGSNFPVSASRGFSYLLGGIMVQWGYVTALAAGGSTNILFASAPGLPNFSAAPYFIGAQIRHNGYDGDGVGCVTAGAPTGFTLKNSSSSDRDYYWVAIGPE